MISVILTVMSEEADIHNNPDLSNSEEVEAQLICYHQCKICGIVFDCDETQQKCGLPFYNTKIKCSLCANRSPLFQRPLKSITYL